MQIISILALAAAAEATFGRSANCDVDCQRDYRAVNYMRSDTSASSYCSSLYPPATSTSVAVATVTSTTTVGIPSTKTVTTQGGSTFTAIQTVLTTLTSTVTSTTDICTEGYPTGSANGQKLKRHFFGGSGSTATTTTTASNPDPSCANAPSCLKGVACTTVQALCKCLMATATPTTVTSTSTSTKLISKTACPVTTTKVLTASTTSTTTKTTTVTTTAIATNNPDIYTDNNNCGGCGNVCQTGTKCEGGMCFARYT